MIEGTPNTTTTDGRTPLKIIREISEEAYVKEKQRQKKLKEQKRLAEKMYTDAVAENQELRNKALIALRDFRRKKESLDNEIISLKEELSSSNTLLAELRTEKLKI